MNDDPNEIIGSGSLATWTRQQFKDELYNIIQQAGLKTTTLDEWDSMCSTIGLMILCCEDTKLQQYITNYYQGDFITRKLFAETGIFKVHGGE